MKRRNKQVGSSNLLKAQQVRQYNQLSLVKHNMCHPHSMWLVLIQLSLTILGQNSSATELSFQSTVMTVTITDAIPLVNVTVKTDG